MDISSYDPTVNYAEKCEALGIAHRTPSGGIKIGPGPEPIETGTIAHYTIARYQHGEWLWYSHTSTHHFENAEDARNQANRENAENWDNPDVVEHPYFPVKITKTTTIEKV